MPDLIVDVSMKPDEVADYYRGFVRHVIARATNGQTVRFPASVLHRHITKDGIHGRFRLVFDEQNKFVRIETANEQ